MLTATRRRARFADVAVVALVLMLLVAAGLAAAQQARATNSRVVCASHLHRIAAAMILYGNTQTRNGLSFPRTEFQPDAPPKFFTGWKQPNSFGAGAPEANDVTAAFYLLLKTGDLQPQMLRCPDTTTKPLAFGNAAGAIAREPKELSNFPSAEYLSYSFQNPYPGAAALLTGFRWNVTLDETYAVAADRNPGEAAARLQAPRYVPPSTQPGARRYGMQSTAAATPAGNSPNHQRAGQNVAYADGHVEWQVTPFAGPVLGSGANQWRDNIYTARTAPDQRTGGKIVAPPFDRDDNILLPAAETKKTK